MAALVASLVNSIYSKVGGYNSEPIGSASRPYATSPTASQGGDGDKPSAATHDDAAQICRICLDGPDATNDKEESLGKLLSPCRCRGTMKYVHAGCLARWRRTSSNTSSAMQCDQCRSPYRFRNSRIIGIARSKWVLLPTSGAVFILLIWMVGLVASLLLERSHGPLEVQAARLDLLRLSGAKDVVFIGSGSRAGGKVTTLDLGEGGPTQEDDEDEYDDHYRYGSWWASEQDVLWHGLSALMRRSIREATGIIAPKVKVAPASAAQKRTAEAAALVEESNKRKDKPSMLGAAWNWWRSDSEPSHDQHDLHTATTSSPTLTPIAQVPVSVEVEAPAQTPTAPPPVQTAPAVAPPIPPNAKEHMSEQQTTLVIQPFSWLEKVPLQLAYGTLLVGLGSFSGLCLSLTRPFVAGRLFTGMAAGGRRRRRGGGGLGGGSTDDARLMLLLIVVLFVLVGLVRALGVVYTLVQKRTAALLLYAEDLIIDWVGDDEDGLGVSDRRAARARAAAAAATRDREVVAALQPVVRDEEPDDVPGADGEVDEQPRQHNVAWAFAQRAMEFQWEEDDEPDEE